MDRAVNAFEEDGSAYVCSNDITRGFDVLRYDAAAPAQVDGGTRLDATQMAARPSYEMVTGNLVPLCASPASSHHHDERPLRKPGAGGRRRA